MRMGVKSDDHIPHDGVSRDRNGYFYLDQDIPTDVYSDLVDTLEVRL